MQLVEYLNVCHRYLTVETVSNIWFFSVSANTLEGLKIYWRRCSAFLETEHSHNSLFILFTSYGAKICASLLQNQLYERHAVNANIEGAYSFEHLTFVSPTPAEALIISGKTISNVIFWKAILNIFINNNSPLRMEGLLIEQNFLKYFTNSKQTEIPRQQEHFQTLK